MSSRHSVVRWAALFALVAGVGAVSLWKPVPEAAPPAVPTPPAPKDEQQVGTHTPDLQAARVARLEAEVATLRDDLGELRARMAAMEVLAHTRQSNADPIEEAEEAEEAKEIEPVFAESVSLPPGGQTLIATPPGLRTVSIPDPELVRVQLSSDGKLVIQGLAPGYSEVLLEVEDRPPMVVGVDVRK